MIEAGTLFVVATPIGNLDDISKRAIDVLGSVNFIAAEDTRVTKILLGRINSSIPVKSYHDFSEAGTDERMIQSIVNGKSVALVCDAGTPLISDPGYKLVQLAREKNITVIPVPGASSVTAALSVSGLPTDCFLFDGFIPSKNVAKTKYFQNLLYEERTTVVFESMHRIENSLVILAEVFPETRRVFIAREISKKFESHFLGSVIECLTWLNANPYNKKGEFVLVIEGCDASIIKGQQHQTGLLIIDKLKNTMSTKDAVRIASEITGAKKNALYEAVLNEG
ncbi:MAG: 16S rRNA (cytidine(1402)-2'-O)-methyltransferase [Gammaproteobacteria bacterium]|nr:16S rRNA (cytidine(1402)-2'-O)-methyltransferase [Gammaproteobacteria bacterium]